MNIKDTSPLNTVSLGALRAVSTVASLGTIRAVANVLNVTPGGLTLINPFAGVYYDRAAGVSDRNPIPSDTIRTIQALCQATDDDLRWLVALVSDTGMRLAEATGLAREDIIRNEDGSLVAVIRPHPWRRLKTKGSERIIPLEGEARWVAERVLEECSSSRFAFPSYNRTETTNANAASAALNKWMKEYVPVGSTMHGFRHSMRDRLRAVECPADVVDQIGGWQTDGVGHEYGSGYPLDVLRRWMKAVT